MNKIFKLYNALKAIQLYIGILTCEGLCFPDWKTLGVVTTQENLFFPLHLKYNSRRGVKTLKKKNLEEFGSF